MGHYIHPRLLERLPLWERLELKSYRDTDGTWHVGYGHGNALGTRPFVDENTVLKDKAEALAILDQDLNETCAPQLNKALEKSGLEVSLFEWNALLDVLYNRGGGRLVGLNGGWYTPDQIADPKIEKFQGSYCWELLRHPELKNYRKLACEALVHSSRSRDGTKLLDEQFNDSFWTPLNVSPDRITKIPRVYLGLTLRRMDDAAIWLTDL